MNATRRRAPSAPRKKIHRPAVRPLAEQLREMADALLMCRDMGHAWGISRPFYKVEVEGGVRGALYVERVAVCLRCDTERIELHRVHKHHVEKLSNRYIYPETYLLHGPDKRQARSKARLEQWNRVQQALAEFEGKDDDGHDHDG